MPGGTYKARGFLCAVYAHLMTGRYVLSAALGTFFADAPPLDNKKGGVCLHLGCQLQ